MKFIFLFALIALLTMNGEGITPLREYDIAQFYKVKELERGTKTITSNGRVEDIGKIFVETDEMYPKTYDVVLIRRGDDFYEIKGTDFYVQTRSCYESAWERKAVLMVKDRWGYTKGKLAFR